MAATTRTSTRRAQALADPPHLPLLQHAQQHALGGERQVADLVEEHRSPLRRLEDAGAVALGAGERAPHVAEEVGQQQALRHRGAVDGDERRAATAAAAVDLARRELLASAALAEDQHRQVRRRQTGEPLQGRGQGWALAHHPCAARGRGRRQLPRRRAVAQVAAHEREQGRERRVDLGRAEHQPAVPETTASPIGASTSAPPGAPATPRARASGRRSSPLTQVSSAVA